MAGLSQTIQTLSERAICRDRSRISNYDPANAFDFEFARGLDFEEVPANGSRRFDKAAQMFESPPRHTHAVILHQKAAPHLSRSARLLQNATETRPPPQPARCS